MYTCYATRTYVYMLCTKNLHRDTQYYTCLHQLKMLIPRYVNEIIINIIRPRVFMKCYFYCFQYSTLSSILMHAPAIYKIVYDRMNTNEKKIETKSKALNYLLIFSIQFIHARRNVYTYIIVYSVRILYLRFSI